MTGNSNPAGIVEEEVVVVVVVCKGPEVPGEKVITIPPGSVIVVA